MNEVEVFECRWRGYLYGGAIDSNRWLAQGDDDAIDSDRRRGQDGSGDNYRNRRRKYIHIPSIDGDKCHAHIDVGDIDSAIVDMLIFGGFMLNYLDDIKI